MLASKLPKPQNEIARGWIKPINAQYVDSSGETTYELVDNKLWHEFSTEGELLHSFTEIDVDGDCICLLDESRKIRITLDLSQSKIRYAPDMNSTRYDIFDITNV